MSDNRSEVEITTGRILLWLLAVVIWVIALPIYLAVFLFRWLTGRPVKAPIWMFTGRP